jgi:hypothetical protein
MPMPSWNDIPHFENMGGGHIVMDVAPDNGCLNCGDWKWHMAVVNTTERQDLLTNKRIKTWCAKSECKKCGTTTIWNINPDKAYPKATDDPFAK